jgi:CMP-N-acetylneuraminic acid synthetase
MTRTDIYKLISNTNDNLENYILTVIDGENTGAKAFYSDGKLIQELSENGFFEKKGANQLVPVVRFSFPPQRGYVVQEDELKFKWPEYMSARSQDLEPFYHDAGQFYFYRVSDYLEKDGMQSSKVVSLELSDMEVQDIDNEDDWKIAEFKYSYFHK